MRLRTGKNGGQRAGIQRQLGIPPKEYYERLQAEMNDAIHLIRNKRYRRNSNFHHDWK
jgi:hypothetical protein